VADSDCVVLSGLGSGRLTAWRDRRLGGEAKHIHKNKWAGAGQGCSVRKESGTVTGLKSMLYAVNEGMDASKSSKHCHRSTGTVPFFSDRPG
jgi:hypothetical protein